MKVKVFSTGLVVLLSLSLLSCGGGGGSGAPGSDSEDTGIQIQSVVLTPVDDTNDIDVFSSPVACPPGEGGEPEDLLTDSLVDMVITAAAYNPDTAFNPFPANITACTVMYTSAVIGAPIIESKTIYSPNCSLSTGTTTCSGLDLLNIARKHQWWNDYSSGKFTPAEYPTRYTVVYSCSFSNNFGKSGKLGGKIDIDLADWLSCG